MRTTRAERRRILRSLVVDVLVLSFLGYLVLIVVAVSYWAASTQEFSVVINAVIGGAFVSFVLVPPTYVALGYFAATRWKMPSSGPAPQEEVPTADEEVPAHPQPQSEQEVPARRPPRHEAEHVAQARITEHDPAQLPEHEGGEDDRPAREGEDARDHATGTYSVRREVIGVAGWIVIITLATAWEILSLFDSDVATFSQHVRTVMTPAVGRAALVVAWIVVGFSLFGPGPE